MKDFLTSLITYSVTYSFLAVGIISFLESLVFVGLLLPGIIIMTTLGTFIGNGKLSFYSSWISGTIGCLLGDWSSYYIGIYFKDYLYKIKFLEKNKKLLKKIKSFLYQHSATTILVGRLLGFTRPFVPVISGMLKLPLKKFILPDLIGCILWPPLYFFPGIITGIAIKIPENSQNYYFKWLLFCLLLLICLGIFFSSQWWKIKNSNNHNQFFTKKRMALLSIVTIFFSLIGIVAIQFHPTALIFKTILYTILFDS